MQNNNTQTPSTSIIITFTHCVQVNGKKETIPQMVGTRQVIGCDTVRDKKKTRISTGFVPFSDLKAPVMVTRHDAVEGVLIPVPPWFGVNLMNPTT